MNGLLPESDFPDEDRMVFYELSQELIPEREGAYSADEAGVPGQFVDEVLRRRPDLLPPLRELLRDARGQDPRRFLEHLGRDRPAVFEQFTFVVAGAYFLSPAVREWLGYRGQVGEFQDGSPQPEYADGGLLDPVIARGPSYRVTPGTVPRPPGSREAASGDRRR